jgi:hypothetical protein
MIIGSALVVLAKPWSSKWRYKTRYETHPNANLQETIAQSAPNAYASDDVSAPEMNNHITLILQASFEKLV